MMGTEKFGGRLVGTTFVSVLLSLLLALTPVLAVAEPANGGGASADAAAIASASTSLVTVPATQTSTGTTSLRATVSYDSNFVKGSATRFTFNVSGNAKPLLYKINAFEIQTASGWSSLVDTSRGELFKFTDKSYFEEEIYTSGNYRLSFYVAEYTDNGDGTKTFEPYVRFEVAFTVAESASFKSMDAIINEVVGQCNSECAKQGDTSDYAKALWLNDWVVDNTEYDHSLTYMSAEGVFGRGLGTCEAYHDAYVRLLNKVGIETRRVDSSGDTHVWTGVKLDGKWYNVDTTWNDPGYTDSNVDLKRLYFALPTDVMKLVHTQWDGTYSLGYPNRAAFDAESYEDNYFIRSGEISKFTRPYLEASGTYSVRTHLNARETSFTIPVASSSYKNVIYNLVAYQLGRENWGSNIRLTATYSDGALNFKVFYLVSIANASIASIETQTYTGKALTPKPTVKVGSTTLKEGTDYTLSYASNVNVGKATVTIMGKGNYTGTKTVAFKIEAQPAAQAPAVTGSWVNSGRWWFSYDAKTRAAQKKAYPAGEWVTVGNRRYHFDGAGWMHSGWLSLSGRWYWLGADGAMRTGWQLVGGAWYYMGPDGAMWTGKRAVGGRTYYLDPSGAMRTGWNLEGSTWYFYDPSGAMAHGWRSVGGTWYFLDKSTGAMRQYWLDDGGQRYFLLSSGAMVTGWARVDGTWYYFGPSGAMQRSRWVGNYYVGSDGRMATSTWVGRYHVNAGGLWDATR